MENPVLEVASIYKSFDIKNIWKCDVSSVAIVTAYNLPSTFIIVPILGSYLEWLFANTEKG